MDRLIPLITSMQFLPKFDSEVDREAVVKELAEECL